MCKNVVEVRLPNPSTMLLGKLEGLGVEWDSDNVVKRSYDIYSPGEYLMYSGGYSIVASVPAEWVPTPEDISRDTVLREIDGAIMFVAPRENKWRDSTIIYVESKSNGSRYAEVSKDFRFHPVRIGDDFGYQEFYYEDEFGERDF